jgi:hypothetical protein
VLDRTQSIGEFVREIEAITDADVPVVGVVLVHRTLIDRRPRRGVDGRARRRRQTSPKVEI